MFYGTFPNGVIFFIQIYVFQYFTSVMIVQFVGGAANFVGGAASVVGGTANFVGGAANFALRTEYPGQYESGRRFCAYGMGYTSVIYVRVRKAYCYM